MAAPPNPNCAFSRRSRCGPAVRGPARQKTGSLVLVSDSLVDDRGCLNHRPKCQALFPDVNLQRRGSLNAPLNQGLR
jgi:hypothetical protein